MFSFDFFKLTLLFISFLKFQLSKTLKIFKDIFKIKQFFSNMMFLSEKTKVEKDNLKL